MRRIKQFFEHTDPEDLLEEDRHLSEQFSLEELAAVTTETRIIWEEEIKSAHASAFSLRICARCWMRQSARTLQSCRHCSFGRHPPPERDKRPGRCSQEESHEEN